MFDILSLDRVTFEVTVYTVRSQKHFPWKRNNTHYTASLFVLIPRMSRS